METKARSNNSAVPEGANEPKKVEKNTDFAEILFDSNEHFYNGNLPEYSNILKTIGREYKNTTTNWEKYYKATIVVPIIFKENDKKYQIMGFFCVDAISTNAFKKEAEKENTSIVKTFADVLYTYLDHCRYYEELLKGLVKGKGGT